MIMNLDQSYLQAMTRRHFFGRTGFSLGSIALGSLLAREGRGAPSAAVNPVAPRAPMFAAKAKRVIYLHMAGSPSQLDLFDDKPMLRKFDGQPCPKELLEGKRFAFIKGVPFMLGSPFKFARHGRSGAELSELLPHFSTVVDDVAILKSMHTDQFNHAPAQLLVHTGTQRLGGASMGSWITYGLGSENENLPGFVVLLSGAKNPDAGKSLWGSGFLPTIHQGVQCRTKGDPVLYLSNPPGLDRSARRDTLDTLRRLNDLQAQALGDPETVTRIAQYELAYRMQMSVPQVMDISKEPRHILDLYGAQPGYVSEADDKDDPRTSYKGTDATFANNCLLARRLVEAGVRFVQIYDWGWDHHGSNPGETINETLPIKCQQIDRAMTGLLLDLKQRGLLEETLVIWGGEFGRTPMKQNNVPNPAGLGRDHQPDSFSLWMAGGGIKGGLTHGRTDDLGVGITQDPVHVHDLQATVLHLLGLDPHKFAYAYQGLNNRLIGPTEDPRVVTELLA